MCVIRILNVHEFSELLEIFLDGLERVWVLAILKI